MPDKERFDYARILLATSSLEVVNVVDKIMVDGVLLEVKIVEEWGFSLGEDACSLEDENDSESAHSTCFGKGATSRSCIT